MRRFITFEPSAVEWAGFMTRPPHFGGTKNHSSPAQRAGLKYERKAQDYLGELYPDHQVPSPWLAFRLKHEPLLRFCQPDTLLVEPELSRVTIIEIKLRHCREAFTQLSGIYDPVVRRLFPRWDIRWVELCKWYDPGIPFPVQPVLLSDISLAPRFGVGVHIWKP